MDPRPPRAWIAAVLSLLLPGLGHVYVGRTGRALRLIVATQVAALALLWIYVAAHGAIWALVILVPALLATWLAFAADAASLARAPRVAARRRRLGRCALYVVGALLVGELEAQLIRAYWVESFRVPAASMQPTLLPGDFFVVDKRALRARQPQRGDVVVFERPGSQGVTYVQRLVGIPGDRIELRDGALLVNGASTHEPCHRGSPGPWSVPPDAYFAIGDDCDRSRDSRHFGAVAEARIRGVASFIYFSRDPDTGAIRWDRIGHSIDQVERGSASRVSGRLGRAGRLSGPGR